MSSHIGVVGLGVMGRNLAANMARNGFAVAGYDLDASKVRAFADAAPAGTAVVGTDSPASLMDALERPRRILVMVPAGKPVDSAIAHLRPHLDRGDIVIDGGNSYFLDTERRSEELAGGGIHFVGVGVSGARRARCGDRA